MFGPTHKVGSKGQVPKIQLGEHFKHFKLNFVYVFNIRGLMAADLNSSLTDIDWLFKPIQIGEEAREGTATQVQTPVGMTQLQNSGSWEEPCRNNSARPPYSYKTLISCAIVSSPEKKLLLRDIYAWIMERFPYYVDAPPAWKVRSPLNRCTKIVKSPVKSR
uniref:Fork-head domain-containing protein n=1 Tax=Eptatretus burgeri TaxID=7764 RepID=A0A8C4PZZ6_EPTBU